VDVDLAKAHHSSDPTVTELKTYVTDAENGLGKDILNKISETLRLDPEKVKGIWEGRFAQTALLRPDGSLEKTPTYISIHQAYYDKGSWLREGAMVQPAKDAQAKAGNGRMNARGEAVDQTQQDKELIKRFPELSEEPDVWWSVQRSETKAVILRAVAAEKLFRVKEVKGKPCPECAGRGAIITNNAAGYMVCPYCRGLKLLYQVFYE